MHAALIAMAITPAVAAVTTAARLAAGYFAAVRNADQDDQPAKAGLWHVGWSTGSPLAESNARQATR